MNEVAKKTEIQLARNIIKNAGLYLVPETRLDTLAEIAADAYRDYPLHNWFTNGVYDPIASKIIMKATLVSIKEDSVIYADSEELNGFSVWLPSGFTGIKSFPFLQNGGVRLLMHSGLGTIQKLLVYESFAMKLKENHTGPLDWYLYNLTVRQFAQGKGIASKLISPMLNFCDDENISVYLETNKEKNLDIYHHYGFELRETNLIPKSSVKHYSMVRNPKEKLTSLSS